ncbi:AroM family protein [Lysinibacillus xylanilyticus]|uniref:AroM family protein n=1 Tax=Lysinibacillus xylanilyticus TaxID=582475 RepID=A0ABT4EUK6_9BACI|nr:AroM family protein [Lysinibacillus xylanilyticus]MCY9549342.1 AroM family protein [Lysinibacillus xylanilyticus]MED3803544.1 AroM family protein [Lysinibacillus xylanilyticus]
MNKVGLLTIGQSPRSDITPTFEEIFDKDIEIVERGALDSLNEAQLLTVIARKEKNICVSRLRDGRSIIMCRRKLLPLLQNELSKMQEEVDMVIVLCTEDLPTLTCEKPIFYPNRIVTQAISAMSDQPKIGLIIPLEEQKRSVLEKWEGVSEDITVAVASPYDYSNFEEAARYLKDYRVDIIILDCMGYNEEHRQFVRKESGILTILPRTLVARIVLEYL